MYKEDIENYAGDVQDIETSAFEMLEMLHLRSKIHSYFNDLSEEEKLEVTRFDLILISNCQRFYDKLKDIYDFNKSRENIDEWWWHLDKLANAINLRTFTISFHKQHGDLVVNYP